MAETTDYADVFFSYLHSLFEDAKSRKISQVNVAKDSGIHRSDVSRLSGSPSSVATLKTCLALARGLQLTPEQTYRLCILSIAAKDPSIVEVATSASALLQKSPDLPWDDPALPLVVCLPGRLSQGGRTTSIPCYTMQTVAGLWKAKKESGGNTDTLRIDDGFLRKHSRFQSPKWFGLRVTQDILKDQGFRNGDVIIFEQVPSEGLPKNVSGIAIARYKDQSLVGELAEAGNGAGVSLVTRSGGRFAVYTSKDASSDLDLRGVALVVWKVLAGSQQGEADHRP